MTKYIVSRTSLHFHDETPPCEEALKETLTHIDKRNCTLEFAKKSWFWEDFTEQNDHWEEIDGKLVGYGKKEVWVVDSTIEEMFKKHGELVIKYTNFVEVPIEIEIYDDWRE